MNLVDIEQEIQFSYYDDITKNWKSHTGTIKEFLSIFCDWRRIQCYSIDFEYLGVINEKERIQRNKN